MAVPRVRQVAAQSEEDVEAAGRANEAVLAYSGATPQTRLCP